MFFFDGPTPEEIEHKEFEEWKDMERHKVLDKLYSQNENRMRKKFSHHKAAKKHFGDILNV